MNTRETRMLTEAIRANTRALLENTRILKRFSSKQDRKSDLDERRNRLMANIPYLKSELKQFRRQELVMLAAALGIKNTSVPNARLVDEIYREQKNA